MTDFNAEFYRCCGHEVTIPGHASTLPDGRTGRQVHCPICGEWLNCPGDLEEARKAIPAHFREKHQLIGELEDYYP
jgi:hypothetical protein